jgi:hypothetical protein
MAAVERVIGAELLDFGREMFLNLGGWASNLQIA